MPYDLFVTTEATASMTSAWEFYGTWPKVWLAYEKRDQAGEQRPELRRWALFYIRRTTAHQGLLHSQGDYAQKESPV